MLAELEAVLTIEPLMVWELHARVGKWARATVRRAYIELVNLGRAQEHWTGKVRKFSLPQSTARDPAREAAVQVDHLHGGRGREMSFNEDRRKFQGRHMTALRQMEAEGVPLIREAAAREPAKVLAFKIGKTPRHVYNLRDGECEPGWLAFIALAQNHAKLRDAVARWLNLDNKSSADAQRALDLLKRLAANMAEEGDQS